MRASPPLCPGDRVAVIAPAGPLPEERLARGLQVLGARYDVRMAPGLRSRHGFLGGDDGRRLAELRWALSDPLVRAIFCGRGGYGAMRLLPWLLPIPREELRPVPLCGFSDITVLHCLLLRAGIRAVHGPVVTQLGSLPPDDVAALFALLESAAPPPPLTGLQPCHPGRATGRLIGGNLELLSRLCGTALALPSCLPAPAVLLLEEIGEQPYRLDRALTQLLLGGALRHVVGVVIGDLVDCEGRGVPAPLDVLVERLRPLGVPIAAGLPVGHGARNRALPLGAAVELVADATGASLHFLEGAVSG